MGRDSSISPMRVPARGWWACGPNTQPRPSSVPLSRSRRACATSRSTFGVGSPARAACECSRGSLRALRYAVPVNGYFDQATARAVLAFRKVTGLERVEGGVDARIFELLQRSAGRFHVRYPGDGNHVEGDLSKQVLVEVARGACAADLHDELGQAIDADRDGSLSRLFEGSWDERARDGGLELLHSRVCDPRVRGSSRPMRPATDVCASRSPMPPPCMGGCRWATPSMSTTRGAVGAAKCAANAGP